MTNDCGDGFRSQFASIPGVAVWAVLPGALTTLTSEVCTDLSRQVLREDIYGLDIMFGEKEHAHVRNIVLGWVGSTVAARLLLALGGSQFCTLVWGGRIMLHIAALILVGVIGKGTSRNGSWSRGTHI